MINRQVMEEILKIKGISRPHLYHLIEKTMRDNFIVDTETAAYYLAFNEGVKIDRYLSSEELAKVQAIKHNIPLTHKPRDAKPKSTKTVTDVVGELPKKYQILSEKILEEANKMAKIYPTIYIFENSVRVVTQSVLEKSHGEHWWNEKVSSKIRKKVESRIHDENKNKWHGKRGAHSIYYTDIEDLSDIIGTNWQDFADYFPDQAWVKTMISVIGRSRNVVAHNNPLSNDDIEAVKVNFKQWTKQITDFKIIERVT